MMRYSALTSLTLAALLIVLVGVVLPTAARAQENDATAATTEAADAETVVEESAAPKGEASKTEEGPQIAAIDQVQYAVDNLFLLIAAVLVLFMQAGFAMVEAGFNSGKNTVNILFKNLMDVSIGVLLFWLIGYNLMYPGDVGNGWFSLSDVGNFIGTTVQTAEVAAGKLHPQVDFLFQVAFAATAATIVSGAVAGRMKFSAYLVYSALLTAVIYPISGMWKWGTGWLQMLETSETFGLAPFHDFAGSLVVHAVGGFAGLAAAIVLGPRIGRFSSDGKSQAMPGHNLSMATLGVFILWIGWYGFNPGSQLAFSTNGDADATMLIAANTTLAAAAGGMAAMLVGWGLFKKPDLSMALNGVLAGLVGITANCDQVTNPSAMAIGGIAGVLVVFGILALDKLRIDDPVGAFPVHGLCGVWGGMATYFFGTGNVSFLSQLTGSIAIPLWAFFTMLIIFLALKATGNLRVSPEEEQKGLDLTEHGMQAYTM
jgi:Amt family ammonium transporter